MIKKRLIGSALILLLITQTSCQRGNSSTAAAVTMPRFAYIVSSYSSPAVNVCTLDQTSGEIISCADAGGASVFGSTDLSGIAANKTNDGVFISNANGDPMVPFVYQCSLHPVTGLFTSCTSTSVTSPTDYTPYEGLMSVNAANSMAYLTDDSARIIACPITAGIMSGNCTDTGATPISSNVTQTVTNLEGTKAYIGNWNIPTGVNICNVSGATFTSCVNKTGGSVASMPFSFTVVGGIALNKSESIVYVPDRDASTIYGCSTATDNSSNFADCFIALSGVNAFNVVLNATNTVAYLTTYFNDVYSCPIQSDGRFGTCASNNSVTSATGLTLIY